MKTNLIKSYVKKKYVVLISLTQRNIIKWKREKGNVSKRQQPDTRADNAGIFCEFWNQNHLKNVSFQILNSSFVQV